jgi:hypothetical protein
MIRTITTIAFLVGLVATATAQPIVTDSTSNSYSKSESTTTVHSPPPSAISPAVTTINSDVCAVGYGGAAQTQILGISFGGTTTDYNCERLKLSKTLYDMGMKVAAVATLCQDRRVWDSMMAAGTPCPVDGKIGQEAKLVWDENPNRIPKPVIEKK